MTAREVQDASASFPFSVRNPTFAPRADELDSLKRYTYEGYHVRVFLPRTDKWVVARQPNGIISRSSTIPDCHETRRIFISTVEIALLLFFFLLFEVLGEGL